MGYFKVIHQQQNAHSWNKKSIGIEQPFLDNVAGGKRNAREGDTHENQFEGQTLRIKYGSQDIRKTRYFRALMCYLVALWKSPFLLSFFWGSNISA